MTTRSSKAKVATAGEPPPNIKFIGKDEVTDKLDPDGQKIVIEAEPLTKINNSEQIITLPHANEQRAGFFHPDAALIVRLYPQLYKTLVGKGGH